MYAIFYIVHPLLRVPRLKTFMLMLGLLEDDCDQITKISVTTIASHVIWLSMSVCIIDPALESADRVSHGPFGSLPYHLFRNNPKPWLVKLLDLLNKCISRFLSLFHGFLRRNHPLARDSNQVLSRRVSYAYEAGGTSRLLGEKWQNVRLG